MPTRYNTGNPIESTDVRDMSDNAKNLDLFSNSSELSFDDRFGVERKTIHGMNSEFDGMIVGMNSEFDAQILNMGFTRVGTFATGATLTNPRQTLLWDIADGGDGQEYGWTGVFQKIVPAGSTPLTTGGIAVGAWMSRFDPEVRGQVREALRRSYAEAGYNLVDGSFEAGGTLVNANDVLLQERTGKGFSGPAGTVAAGTVPSGPNYINRGDETLRSDLANPDKGAAMVGFRQAGVEAVNRTALSKMRDTVNVKDFGAVPSDIAFADLNEEAFYKALSCGKPVVMDDTYYVRVNATREVDVDLIHLTSETTENKIIFTPDSSGVWLRIVRCKNIKLSGCCISNPLENTAQVELIHLPETVYVDEAAFKGNKLNGRVRVCSSSFNPEIDPANKSYGVGRFSIVDNEAVDVLTSCFSLSNMPCDMFIIKGNTVGNFLGTFVSSGITNASTYENDLFEAKAMLICADNVVVWDDDYFAPPFSGSYLAFLLFEGSYMEERNNHFEGIKTRDVVATYGTYFSGGTIVSSGNTVKNIMCFNSNKQNADLLKSKEAANRHYSNNHFIVEEDFILRHGGSYENDDSWVMISGQTSNAQMFECLDNTFDIFHLQGRWTTEATLNVTFKRNTFNCVNYGGYLVGSRSTGIDYDTIDAVVEVEDNSIVTRYMRSHRETTAGFLLSGGDSGDVENAYRLISIKRNTLTETGGLPTPEEHAMALVMNTVNLSCAHTRRLETGGNKIRTNNSRTTIVSISELYGPLNTGNVLDIFNADGDEKSSLGPIRFNLTPFNLTDCPKVLIKNKVSGLFPDVSLIQSAIRRPASGSRLVRLTLKGTFGGVPIGGTISCTISQTEIHFINSAGEPASLPIVDGASSFVVAPKVYGLESEGFGSFTVLSFRYYTGASNDHVLRPTAVRYDLIGKSGWMEMTLETQDFE